MVSGIGYVRHLLDRIESGEAKYDFVEVCPGQGQGGAGGQLCSGAFTSGLLVMAALSSRQGSPACLSVGMQRFGAYA